jgi:predicted amino acid-binding ACT domain protein
MMVNELELEFLSMEWKQWFESEWEEWLRMGGQHENYSQLRKTILAIPQCINDPKFIKKVDSDPEYFIGEIDFALPLVLLYQWRTGKGIMREFAARANGAIGIIEKILQHQEKFGKAEINRVKQDLYENFSIELVSVSHNHRATTYLLDNLEEELAKKRMNVHIHVIDSFIEQMTKDGIISLEGNIFSICEN